ncbi:MAG: hypothetical protein HN368_02595 [Spirochaetales bacterium]|nr:hypothetical protein [Spirochaetales bacterium]
MHYIRLTYIEESDTLFGMKLIKKNAGLFTLLFILGLISGTFAWEILERILQIAGVGLDLGVGPIGFDLDVLAVYLTVNPGSLLGAGSGIFLFFRL